MVQRIKTLDIERPKLVGAMVSEPVHKAIKKLAVKKDRSVSYIASRVLELDPEALKEYREALKDAKVA